MSMVDKMHTLNSKLKERGENQIPETCASLLHPRQAQGSKLPFDPNCLSIVLSCSQGILANQTPSRLAGLRLTAKNAPVRNGHNGV